MPQREQGEKLSSFIGRFMSNKPERRKFPNSKQRLAVAYSEGGERARKDQHGKA